MPPHGMERHKSGKEYKPGLVIMLRYSC